MGVGHDEQGGWDHLEKRVTVKGITMIRAKRGI
jgi:hypothetical protein